MQINLKGFQASNWLIRLEFASIVNNQVPFLHQLTLLMVIVSNIQYFILTVFENYRKSLIQHFERSELGLHFEWTQKLIKYDKKCHFWRVFENLNLAVKQCYQTGHFKYDKNWWKVPKVKNQKCDILSSFQTL